MSEPNTDVVRFDLEDEDEDDAHVLANRIDELRVLVDAGCKVELLNCPQALAHTLYRSGLLRGGRVVIVNMRAEEPYE